MITISLTPNDSIICQNIYIECFVIIPSVSPIVLLHRLIFKGDFLAILGSTVKFKLYVPPLSLVLKNVLIISCYIPEFNST
jgi:hypothetical protein